MYGADDRQCMIVHSSAGSRMSGRGDVAAKAAANRSSLKTLLQGAPGSTAGSALSLWRFAQTQGNNQSENRSPYRFLGKTVPPAYLQGRVVILVRGDGWAGR
jgi:hypothetical protein